MLEVFGRGDDGDLFDRAIVEQFPRDPKSERRLSRTRRRHREEVGRPGREVLRERSTLPGA